MNYEWFQNPNNETLYRVDDKMIEFSLDFFVKENNCMWFKSTLTRDSFFDMVKEDKILWITEPEKD